jgi:hypothetical protein
VTVATLGRIDKASHLGLIFNHIQQVPLDIRNRLPDVLKHFHGYWCPDPLLSHGGTTSTALSRSILNATIATGCVWYIVVELEKNPDPKRHSELEAGEASHAVSLHIYKSCQQARKIRACRAMKCLKKFFHNAK